MPADKKQKLAIFLQLFLSRDEASLSDLASYRGRVQHYSACLPNILPFAAFISSIIGSEDDLDYDRIISLPPLLRDVSDFLLSVLERH